jgi:hypothetical protein
MLSCSTPLISCTGRASRRRLPPTRHPRLQISSPPLPQLLPHLHEGLDLARAGKMVVEKAAVAIRLLVKIMNRRQAQMREVVTEFLEALLAQHLSLSLVGTPSHAGAILQCSLFIRHTVCGALCGVQLGSGSPYRLAGSKNCMVFPQSMYSPARVSNGALAAKESVPAPCMLLKMRCGGFSSPPFRTNSLGTTHNRPFPSCPILCPLGFFFADSGRRKCQECRRCSLLEDPLNRVCLGLQEYASSSFMCSRGVPTAMCSGTFFGWLCTTKVYSGLRIRHCHGIIYTHPDLAVRGQCAKW